jgi:hypothetical protein
MVRDLMRSSWEASARKLPERSMSRRSMAERNWMYCSQARARAIAVMSTSVSFTRWSRRSRGP